TISTAGTVAFAMELPERGMWDSGLHFGSTEGVDQMIHDIAHREGKGDELANGSKKMAEKFGGMEFAIQAKGMELSAYEPRASFGQGLGYAVSNRGGCHLNAGYLVFAEGLGLDVNGLRPLGKGQLAITFQNLMEAISAAGACLFTSYAVFPSFVFDRPNHPITRLVNWIMPYLAPVLFLVNLIYPVLQLQAPFLVPHSAAVEKASGMMLKVGDFLVAGDRGWNTERAANIILGQKPGADALPKRLTDEKQEPGTGLSVPLKPMLRAFYANRGWINGVPTMLKLKTLGIKVPQGTENLFPGGIF
ncbi:MAG: aldehyde ferredoxin oxidoreductase C-terminal domain-containing protein, partial [Clostridia bacterium]|nr:aldehyde ferredoxin oxidoreductase C-terminal domain-containing protein [Clostridia bacterium]